MNVSYSLNNTPATYPEFLECFSTPSCTLAPTAEAQADRLRESVATLRSQGDYESIELLCNLAAILQDRSAADLSGAVAILVDATAKKQFTRQYDFAMQFIRCLD